MVDIKFYRCDTCGNIVIKLHDSDVAVACCGKPMTELSPNTVDAAQEKHVPAITVDGNVVEVQVGSVEHPMEQDHYIEFILLHTTRGTQCARLQPGDKPQATFVLAEGVEAVEAFEYCNKHGLWKATV